MEKTKVLLLIDKLGGGGAERVVIDIAVNLPPDFDVVVVETRDSGTSSYVNQLVERGAKLITIGRKSKYDVTGFIRLRKFINEYRPDIIHSHKYGSNVLSRLIKLTCKQFPILICHEHTWSYDKSQYLRILINKSLSPLSDVIVAVSENDKVQLIDVEGISASRIKTIYNGIDFARLTPNIRRDDLLASLGIGLPSFVAVTIAKLQSQKGHEFLIKAVPKIIEKHPHFTLLLVGEGYLETKLRELAVELNVDKFVYFLGFRNDIGNILSASDLVVLPSLFEGHPLALLEAMAMGKLVIATNVGGVPEVIKNGENGILIAPNSVDEIFKAVNEIIENKDSYKPFEKSAFLDVRSRFSMSSAIDQYVSLYRQLLNSRKSIRNESFTPNINP